METNIEIVIKNRADYFRKISHKYEAQRLEECLRTIKELIPPQNFNADSISGESLKWIRENFNQKHNGWASNKWKNGTNQPFFTDEELSKKINNGGCMAVAPPCP